MIAALQHYINQVRRTYRHHEEPPETAFVCLITCMSYIGVWPVPADVHSPTKYYPIVSGAYRVYNRIIYFGITAMTFTMALDILRPETLNSVILIADDLTMCTGVAMVWFKAYWWYRNHAAMVRLFVDLERRYAAARSADARFRALRRGYYLEDAVIFAVLGMSVVVLYVTFTMQPYVRDDRNLMYRAVFPWNTQSEWGYRVTCLLQFVDTTPVLLSILCMEVAGVMVVNHVTMHLHILRLKWERLGEERNGAMRDDGVFQTAMRRRVAELVRDHHSIMDLLDDIHAIYAPMYQVQVCSSTCTFCTSAVNILLTIGSDPMYSLRFLCFMLASFFQLLFWCWAGQRTFDMSTQINAAAYTCNWVDMGVPLRRSIALVLMRTQTPLEFTAAPFYVMNYESFVAILSGSYSYFTLLRTLLDS